MNKVILIGNTTKDIEVREGNTPVAKFNLAVSRAFKKDETDFINCVAFGKTAETLAQYVTKGTKIAIEGRIQTGSYDNKEGNKVFTTDIVIERFEFVGGKANNNNNNTSKKEESKGLDDMIPVDDGDMPF